MTTQGRHAGEGGRSVLLVDEDGAVLAQRLRMQGYRVAEVTDAAEGARLAMATPPDAIVADLWSRGISGVQLCRLLGAEPSTTHVPVVLRGPDGHRAHFWARRAGAAAYVPRGRVGDLVRALVTAIAVVPPSEAFFTELGPTIDLRDRVAAHLDQALFDSVVASDVRALGACETFDRLFDLLSQFMVQVSDYRWLAVTLDAPRRLALHTRATTRHATETEARSALGVPTDAHLVVVEDDDAHADQAGPAPLIRRIALGASSVGHIAMAPSSEATGEDVRLLEVVARELAGPLRVVTLMEETLRLATIDALTGLSNRRAFVLDLANEMARAQRHTRPLSVILLDVDHFKRINDTHGHASGDAVLAAVGRLLSRSARAGDLVARWGGEEFVVALHHCDLDGAVLAAERIRRDLEATTVESPTGAVHITASMGVTALRGHETLDGLVDRADRAMYRAKSAGRNRVEVAHQPCGDAVAAEE